MKVLFIGDSGKKSVVFDTPILPRQGDIVSIFGTAYPLCRVDEVVINYDKDMDRQMQSTQHLTAIVTVSIK